MGRSPGCHDRPERLRPRGIEPPSYRRVHVDPPPPAITYLIGCTHVLFNPARGDIKLGQVRVLLEVMQQQREFWEAKGLRAHTIVCGDFNTCPNSAVVPAAEPGDSGP